MAGNFNAFDTFNSARQASYDGLNQVRQDRGRMQAGKALQGGDYQGAAGALYGAGDLQAGMQVQQGQEHQEDRQFRHDQQTMEQQKAQAAQKAEYMKRAGIAIKQIPAPAGPDGRPDLTARRQAYVGSVAPALMQLGMPRDAAEQAADHLDDASLDTFIGEIDRHLQVINRGGGGYDVLDTNSGKVTPGPEPTQKAPVGYTYGEDGRLEIDPAYVAGQGQISSARAAGVAAHRPAPRGRSGGGGGSNGIPAGYRIKGGQ